MPVRSLATLAILLAVALAGTVAVGWLLGVAVESTGAPGHSSFDRPVAEEIAGLRDPQTTGAVKAVTWFGNRGVALGAMAVISLGLWVAFKRREAALFLAASVLGGYTVSRLVKDLVGRVRPPDALVHADGGSFPSGHSIVAVTLYGGLALILWRFSADERRGANDSTGVLRAVAAIAAALAVVLIVLIAAGRVYLGVHWPSDTIGGALLGAAWMGICAAAWSRWDRRSQA